jgi:ketosteroid isomerase-like protein
VTVTRRFLLRLAPALALSLAPACRGPDPGRGEDAERRAVERVLDDWHAAAARADGARYFGHMSADAVFLGTDASERWDLPAFRAFCEPYFARGMGWTYGSRERHVRVDGRLAWFDERLWNEKYGECRGSGVLRHEAGAWRIVHYNLALPVPNELAPEVVAMIRGR